MTFHSFSNGDPTVVPGEARVKTVLVYMPYDGSDQPGEKVRELGDISSRRGLKLVLGCDANEHHSQWGSADNNKKGESVFDFIFLYKRWEGSNSYYIDEL